MDDEEAAKRIAHEMCARYGRDALRRLGERAELAAAQGDHASAATWREIRAAASAVLKFSAAQTGGAIGRPARAARRRGRGERALRPALLNFALALLAAALALLAGLVAFALGSLGPLSAPPWQLPALILIALLILSALAIVAAEMGNKTRERALREARAEARAARLQDLLARQRRRIARLHVRRADDRRRVVRAGQELERFLTTVLGNLDFAIRRTESAGLVNHLAAAREAARGCAAVVGGLLMNRPRPQPAEMAIADAGARIMVVEDDADVRDYIGKVLQRVGFTVIAAADGAEALRRLAEAEPIDVLCTDIVMPGDINGYEVARRARMIRPNIKVVFMSAYSERGEPSIGGATPFLAKPFRGSELVDTLRLVISA